MATPSASSHATPPPQHTPAMSPTKSHEQTVDNIPRRLMRVKVLYTFDDQNKSNCLARLPDALNIPTVSLDENTQVGVIELKTCIQTVVGASPELVAKLGHDYTVYAYDYSEYETPLVGQGMLSWLLASASPTPNAPAEQSKTMVTGRVCKNILGLFSNGIKETLEVKLKLVPVPTCMRSEYVENMERYHNLSKIVPEGMSDFNAWAEFLNANPTIRQLAQPMSQSHPHAITRHQSAGPGTFHDVLARRPPNDESMQPNSFHSDSVRPDSFHDRYDHQYGYNTFDQPQNDRASSPAMSTTSLQGYSYQQNPTRPVSQASFHSEPPNQLKHSLPPSNFGDEEHEEGPPKKRAHITKAKRPKKNSALSINADSLRVTASSAASVRNVRPIGPTPGVAVSVEQVPRAPTPRPGAPSSHMNNALRRLPAPSLLRNASVDEDRASYISPYDHGNMSDNAAESPEEKTRSPAETPMTLPSSPPPMPRRTLSPSRASPELPLLPPPHASTDSGFVSDLPVANDEAITQETAQPGSQEAAAFESKFRKRADNSKRAWAEEIPGPADRLPQSYVPRVSLYGPYGRLRDKSSLLTAAPTGSDLKVTSTQNDILVAGKERDTEPLGPATQADEEFMRSFEDHFNSGAANDIDQEHLSASIPPPPDMVPTRHSLQNSQPNPSPIPQDNVALPPPSMNGRDVIAEISNHPPESSRPARTKGLPRSHTWSGGDAMLQPTPETDPTAQPAKLSSLGLRQGEWIREKMTRAISAGEMPLYCNNCGQIETPAWRRAFMRVEEGIPHDIKVSSEGTDITAFEIMEPEENGDGVPRYRIFKLLLEAQEIHSGTFTTLTLCNPCGLWLGKKNAMRPYHIWSKHNRDKEKKKRKRPPRKRKPDDNTTTSDAVFPQSEANESVSKQDSGAPASLDGTVEQESGVAAPQRSSSAGAGTDVRSSGDPTAQAELLRAIQSSPVGLRRGNRDSPIHLDNDLTPKPTRRLLFPSPRQPGMKKSLSDNRSLHTLKPQPPSSKDHEDATPEIDPDEIDKENCPPPTGDANHELAHLFEETPSQKTTPTGRNMEDLLKTPTPTSRHKPLTPRCNGDGGSAATPSRTMRTPRTNGKAATVAPETPFTRQLNALLSEGMPSSPSQPIDFSVFATFDTPGRNLGTAAYSDLLTGEFSSDFPVPSSPPMALGFSVFEDPSASNVDFWNGAGIFGGDGMMSSPAEEGTETDQQKPDADVPPFKMQGIGADFDALIAQVAGDSTRTPTHREEDADAQNRPPVISASNVTDGVQRTGDDAKPAQERQCETPAAHIKVESPGDASDGHSTVADESPTPQEEATMHTPELPNEDVATDAKPA